jgi:NTE family protein
MGVAVDGVLNAQAPGASWSPETDDTLRNVNGKSQPLRVFAPILAQEAGPPRYFLSHRQLARPRVGLALSGGGARAIFQIGVLQALEAHNIPIDFIAGTSMGSVVGGLYAAGYTAKQLHEIVRTVPWDDITVDTPPRTSLFLAQKQERDRAFLQVRFRGFKPYIPPALTAGQKLLTVLTNLTMRSNDGASSNFDHLRIPFRAVAVDLHSGREILIAEGDLAEAMRASLAVPFLFAPVPQGDMLLADGGLINNIPVDVARRHADVIIAVDASSKLRRKDDLDGPWQIADQVTTIMQRDHNEAQRRKAEVLIALDDNNRTSSDFSGLDSLIEAGYRGTLEQIEKIRALTGSREMNGLLPASSGQIFPIQTLLVRGSELMSGWLQWRDEVPDSIAGTARHLVWGKFFRSHPPIATPNRNESGNHARLLLGADEIQTWVEAVYASGEYATVRAELRADSLILVVQENPRLQEVRFSGNTVYHDSTLRACMQSRPGEVINHKRSHADLNAIVERYRKDGYALAEIRDVSFDAATGVLQIHLDEGRIDRIEIDGLSRTQKMVVLREFPQKPGDIVNSEICSRGIRNIHSTGLFDQVTLNIKRGGNGAVVKIKVQEKPFTIVRLGGHHDSERGTRGFFEAGDENAFGTGGKIFAYGEKGSRDLLTRLSLRTDRLFTTYVSLAANAYYHARDNLIYESLRKDAIGEYTEERLGVHIALGQQLRRLGAVSAELRLEEVQTEPRDGYGYPTGNATLNALILRSIVDTRDRLPFPRGGRYVHIFYENAYSELGARDSFFRFFLRMETFHSRGPHTFHPKLSLGTSDRTTPFSEQFRLGGPEEVYGLRDQELIGRHFLLGSFEYRYQIRRRPLFDSYLSLRYDYSGLWIDKRDVNYRKFRHALGISFGVDTPLGSVSIAYGRYENLQQRVYLSVGYNF